MTRFARTLTRRFPGQPARARAPGTPNAGWTLLELMGVMAIVVILAAVLSPSLVHYHHESLRKHESRSLLGLADGLRALVRAERVIPHATNLATRLATSLDSQIDEIRLNTVRQRRVFWVDPALRIGPTTNSVLPYTQSRLGSVTPINPRLAIFSSVGDELPVGVVSGVAPTEAAFAEIWNGQDGAVTNTGLPAGWVGHWGDDLRIERVDLTPLFVPLLLNNDNGSLGRFAIDGSETNTLPSTPSFGSTYLLDTVLALHGSDGIRQAVEVLSEPKAFSFEKGIWRGSLFVGRGVRNVTGLDLQAAYELFIGAPWNPGAKQSVHQIDVINAMATYMSNYIAWAQASFPSSPSNKKPVTDAQSALRTVSANLMFKP